MLQRFSYIRVCWFSTDKSIRNVAGKLRNEWNSIMVMTGAGLSTPSGIPDFRSPGSGLYSNLEKYKLPSPEAMFDIQYFKINPKPFYDFAKEIYPGNYKPNIGHYFLHLLQEKRKLLRLFTQNIDGLERLAGINEELLVEAHGTFSTASCIQCKTEYDSDLLKKNVFDDIITRCTVCEGLIKPDIVFFGEELPRRYRYHSFADPDEADLLIIIGTSLEVYPFASIPELLPANTPRLLINREPVGYIGTRSNDIVFKGDIIRTIKSLCKEAGWWDELNDLVNKRDN